jgi:site-specific DNA recombinase
MWSWSRFSRDQNDAQFYKALLRRHGVDLLTVDDEVPHVDGFEHILEALIHWKDQRENEARGQATKRGHHALARMGYLPAGDGNVPTGYRAILVPVTIGGRERKARRIELDPDVAPQVRRAYDMRLNGATFAAINEVCRLYRHCNDLGTMFRDGTYRGIYHWGETEISVPAIVTPQEWHVVHDGLARGRGGAYPRTRVSTYLLSGTVWCGQCGAQMKGHSSNPRGVRYHSYRCDTRGCAIRGIRREAMEREIVALLLDRVLTPRWVADAAERLRAVADDGPERARQELRQRIARLDHAIANLLAMAEEAADVREFGGRLRDRQQERARLERELAALCVAVPPVPWAGDVDGMRQRLQDALEHGDRSSAREIVRLCVARVTVEARDTWRVQWRGA